MTVHRPWSHRAELAAEATSAFQARAFVSRHLLAHELPHLVDDVELVVSELVTNALLHASPPFSVFLGAAGDTVRLEVLDGSEDSPTLVVARVLDTGGRGISIVKAVSRDWGVDTEASGGKSVWAAFEASPSSDPRA